MRPAVTTRNMAEDDAVEPTSSLLDACKAGKMAEVQKLCNTKSLRVRDAQSGWSALTWASAKGHHEVVKFLLEQGGMEAELEAASQVPVKPAEEARDEDSPPQPTVSTTSPLHWAAYKGHAEVLWTLLLHGMSPLALDSEGNTPLHLAAAGGHLTIVKTLLSVSMPVSGVETPVSVQAKNIYGNTPMHVSKSDECKKLLQEAAAAAVAGRPFLCSHSGEFVSAVGSIPASVIDRVSAPNVRPVRYSKECAEQITAAEDTLQAAIKTLADPDAIEAALEAAEAVSAAVPLLDHAQTALLRLQAQIALQDRMVEVNQQRPLPSRALLKAMMGPLKQCRERMALPALIEQGDRLIHTINAEVALTECMAASEAFAMTEDHVKAGEKGNEVIPPSHPFAIQADACIVQLDGLIAAAQMTETLDAVIQAGEAILRRLTGESEVRKALDEPEASEEPAPSGKPGTMTTVWTHAGGQKSSSLLEKLQLQTSSLNSAILICEEEGVDEAVMRRAKAKALLLEKALQAETAADEERKAKEAAAAAKGSKKKGK
eukprot:scaffold11717_cov123-Isochrysis_galbana.AAC.2